LWMDDFLTHGIIWAGAIFGCDQATLLVAIYGQGVGTFFCTAIYSSFKTLMVPWLLAANKIFVSRFQHTLLTNRLESSSASSPCGSPKAKTQPGWPSFSDHGGPAYRDGIGRVQLVREDRLGERLVVGVDRTVLRATRDVVAVGREPDKVFLVRVPRKRAHAVGARHVPEPQRAVRRSERPTDDRSIIRSGQRAHVLRRRPGRGQRCAYADTSSSRFRNLTYETALRWPLSTISGSRGRRKS
jgi:hypothetical protein